MTALLLVTSCRSKESPRAAYVPVSQLEQTYGQLISVANAATPYQNGTGDLLGLFRDDSGTVWGIPLSVSVVGTVLGCAPPMLHEAPVSDTLPATEIVGAANEPTGWRGGTGKLGLMLRDAQGKLHWQLVAPIEIMSGPVCWSQSEPVQVLKNYRLVKAVIKA
ncbi:MAG TPA: hypothetical protein VE135_12950 [Pyrinomonadaceae bacterium]|nr:hypothetical protein [Pyrinomonadaceae bacterium]